MHIRFFYIIYTTLEVFPKFQDMLLPLVYKTQTAPYYFISKVSFPKLILKIYTKSHPEDQFPNFDSFMYINKL